MSLLKTASVEKRSKSFERAKQTSKREYYLDNLKAFLTVMMVLTHVTNMLSATYDLTLAPYYHSFLVSGMTVYFVNQSYYMCLFFFISGYFTASSYDKKGPAKFMADKLKRLGVPLLVYALFLGPLLNWTVMIHLANTGITYQYRISVQQTWFLLWLLIFNACYLVMDQTVPIYVAKLPSLTRLMIIGMGLGVTQLICYVILPSHEFISMPAVLGSLPFHIVFFCGGVMAKRNEWLRSLDQYSSRVVGVAMLGFIALMILMNFVIYIGDLGIWMPKKGQFTDCSGESEEAIDLVIGCLYLFVGVVTGLGAMIMSLGMLQFAKRFWNYRSPWTKFLSEQAYAAYLVHNWVIVIVAWSWTSITDAVTGAKSEFCGEVTNSTLKPYSATNLTRFSETYLVYLGVLYILILGLPISWALAWCIRKVPGFNKFI